MRRVTILGSTGSVGQSTVDLLLRNPDAFAVEALTANRNPVRLAEQARRLGARFAAIGDPAHYPALKEALAGTGIETACGPASLIEAAQRPAEWVMAGIVGAAGLAPTLAAIRRGVIVALANKEVLVCAGALFMQEVARSRRHLAAGRQRAQRDLAMLRLRPGRGDREDHPDLQRRPVSRARDRGDAQGYPAAGGRPSELEHGRENLGRFGDHDEQGARS